MNKNTLKLLYMSGVTLSLLLLGLNLFVKHGIWPIDTIDTTAQIALQFNESIEKKSNIFYHPSIGSINIPETPFHPYPLQFPGFFFVFVSFFCRVFLRTFAISKKKQTNKHMRIP